MSALEIMLEIIEEHTPNTIWSGALLESFRHVPNSNRGDIGEAFILRYLQKHGVAAVSKGSRASRSDIEILNKDFELKTASEGANGTFQFNHIRLDRPYDYLICLGIQPSKILFNIWSKGSVAEGKAGRLVRMAEGQSVTFKLTKRTDTMRNIEEMPDWFRTNLGRSERRD